MTAYALTRATVLLLLLCAAMLMGCASNSPTLPPAPVTPAAIPKPPVSPELPPSGTYWQRVCAFRSSLQERLKITRPMPEACTKAGKP